MKRAINTVGALDLLFLASLIAASFVSEAMSDLLYYASFLLPITVGFFLIIKRRGELRKDAGREFISAAVRLDGPREKLLFSLPLAFPTVALVCLLSFLTSLLMKLCGIDSAIVPDSSFPIALIAHAAAPAIFEEVLFRFIPIALFSAEGRAPREYAIIFSAAMFALGHTSLLQIPYAFFAGCIFGWITVCTGSILPSIIIHFVNNCISLVAIYFEIDLIVYIAIAALALASLIVIIIKRRTYAAAFRAAFVRECYEAPGAVTMVFAFICILFAATAAI